MELADLKATLEDAGYETEPYSGRGMFGRECVSINIDDDAELFILGFKLGEAEADYDIVSAVKTDSMGRGMVVYWPRADW